jgi:mannose-1-phosphate guanylyltransferase
MSRVRTPKHLLALVSARTLIAETVARLEQTVPRSNIFVLTAEAQLEGVRAALPDLPPDQIVAEPARRDTGPAAALATALIRSRNPDALIGLFPADAFIRDGVRFAGQLRAAFGLLSGPTPAIPPDTLLTFGIKPSFASTGFGYLELGENLAHSPGGAVRRVLRFVEKPDAATARRYVTEGRHAWNAGMFIWRASGFLAEAERQAPALAAFIRDFPAKDAGSYIKERFPQLPKISVDYAIMEKATTVATVLAEFDWDDVGAWSALPPHLSQDSAGNAVRGQVAAVNSSRNIVVSNGRVIALCGVNDLVVVETPDAVLVCHRDAVQEIKQLQPLLPKEVL